jgi:hypothetical protein
MASFIHVQHIGQIKTEYVVWVTHTPSATEQKQTLPYRLAVGSPLKVEIGSDGMALCVMEWVPHLAPAVGHQLIVVESIYLKRVTSGSSVVRSNARYQIQGLFYDQTAAILRLVRGAGITSTEQALAARASTVGLAPHLDDSYVFGTHKDPWFFDGGTGWVPTPSMYGYPCISSVTITAAIWERSVAMTLVLYSQPPSYTLPLDAALREMQLQVFAISALVNFAGMYNATPETVDDRKLGFMSMGTNGDCDDMSAAAAAVANFIISSANPCGPGVAHACWDWLGRTCSKAVVCLGYAVSKARVSGGAVVPDGEGGGHCWAMLLPKATSDPCLLTSSLILEGTKQTYNHAAPFDTLLSMGLYVPPHLLYEPGAPPETNAGKMKPLLASQYQVVVYVLDKGACWTVRSADGKFGAAYDECLRPGSGVKTILLGTATNWYETLAAKFGVPMTHVFPLAGIDARWAVDGRLWEELSYGYALNAGDLPTKDSVTMGHVSIPSEAVYTLGAGISFAMNFN